MNQTYPRLIALGSRKRAKRAALSRTGPIFVESEAGRSIVIESLRARARACIRLPPPLSSTPPRSTMIPPPRPSPRYRERKRDSVFSPTRPPRSVSAFFHVRYCMVGGVRGKVGPRAKSIRRTVFAVVKRRSDTTLARGHFRCRRPRSSYRF